MGAFFLILLIAVCIVILFIIMKSSKKPTIPSTPLERIIIAEDKKRVGKHFKFYNYDDEEDIIPNVWYHLARWQKPNFLKIKTDWTKDWKGFSAEEEVVGVTRNNRKENFLIMGDQPDFKIFLERERSNPVDPNAIKVMGSATVDGKPMIGQLGYLSKEFSEKLKDEEEIDARPNYVELPYEDRYYKLVIRVLVRKASYKKNKK